MKRATLFATMAIVVLILGAFGVAYFLWRPPEASPSGVCTVYDYVEADTVVVKVMNVTTTIGNTTTIYTESSTITPTPILTASSAFTTEVPTNVTAYPVTTTSTAGFPGLIWKVTVCTFAL